MNAVTSMQSASPQQKLFASIVLTAIDDAIVEEKKCGAGVIGIARWARSRDGQLVLRCAGIEPSQRAVDGLQNFVRDGIRTSCALSRHGKKNTSLAA